MTPVFSIVIPVHDAAPHVRACLDSLAAQTFSDWEAVCVDDGSTDESGAILDEYARRDGRFRVIHQPNGGAGAARNAALDRTRGDWIAFVDADDYVSEDFLEGLRGSLGRADVVFFNFEMETPSGERRQWRHPASGVLEMETGEAGKALFMRCASPQGDLFGWTCNKIIRRTLLSDNALRFRQDLRLCEDEIFALDVCRHARSVVFLDFCPYHYRVLESGLLAARDRVDSGHLADVYLEAAAAQADCWLRLLAQYRAAHFLARDFKRRRDWRSASRLIGLGASLRRHVRLVGLRGRLVRPLLRFRSAATFLFYALAKLSGVYGVEVAPVDGAAPVAAGWPSAGRGASTHG